MKTDSPEDQDNDNCPLCGNDTLDMGYGLAGGGIGVYFYCTTDGCDQFDKTPDPELSTPEEMRDNIKEDDY
jgi:hypothetical protein